MVLQTSAPVQNPYKDRHWHAVPWVRLCFSIFCIIFCIFCILFCIQQHIIWHIQHILYIAICKICRIWALHYLVAYFVADVVRCFAYSSILFDIFSIFCILQYAEYAEYEPCTIFFAYYLAYCAYYVAYIWINMQNSMQTPKSICRIVQGSYFAYW